FDGIVNIDATNATQSFAIYNDCDDTEIACNYLGDVSFENLQANQIYYLRMFQGYENVHQLNRFFNIQFTEVLSIPTENIFNTSLTLIGNNSLLIQNLNTPSTLELYNV